MADDLQPGSPALASRLSNRTVLCDRWALTLLAMNSVFAVWELTLGMRAIGIADALVTPLLALPLLLNRRGYKQSARLVLIVVTNLDVFIFCAMQGKSAGVYLYFFPMITLPWALFGRRLRPFKWPATLLPAALLAILELTGYRPLPFLPRYPAPEVYFYGSAAAAFLFSYLSLHYFGKSQRLHEEALTRLVGELESERRKLLLQQAQMVASAKMAALGEMAGGVAHEINNPLTAIKLLSGQLVVAAPSSSVAAMANKIKATVDRIARIIDALLRFSRESDSGPVEDTALNRIVDDTLDLCQARFKNRGVLLEVERAGEDVRARCNPVLVSQALLNLLNNAFDAVNGQVRPCVCVRVAHTDGCCQISVADNGPGVPETLRDRIFEPFFTTKPIGAGVGVGLSITKGIVEAQHGTLELTTGGQGACFSIRFPDAEPVAAEAARPHH
jgi:signal transduction histidine kinase